jgi:D-alanyl-lipoteichoic acid acyltransferase DltB (MBOAT superfamily)
MLFNSIEFLVFFIVVAAVYPLLDYRRQNLWLLIASYFFYGSWNWRFLLLLFASALVDYTVGLQIARSDRERTRRAWLAVSIAFNLSVLAYFKYLNFFLASATALVQALGLPVQTNTLQIILPAGISFFLFQSMSYAIDLYRRQTRVIEYLPDYLLYTSFFPNMLAGPIERPSHLSGQLRAPRVVTPGGVYSGLALVLWGLFKKVCVADNLAGYVNAVYGNVPHHSGPTLVAATYLFAFQIYCDFSGYSDMAIGMARILGIDLITNFRTPYFSRSIQEFWHRWHISLSTWFRDYVYFPLGGNRGGAARTLVNIMIVFLVSGLWHGANWTFVVWGGLHGSYLILERVLGLVNADGARTRGPVSRALATLVTFNLVCLAWIFFRSNDVSDAWLVLQRIASVSGPVFWDPSLVPGLLSLVILFAVEALVEPESPDLIFVRRPPVVQGILAVSVLVCVLFLGSKASAQFIYFQF